MPRRHLHTTGAAGTPLRMALRALRTELALPEDFPADVLAEAAEAVRNPLVSGHEGSSKVLFAPA